VNLDPNIMMATSIGSVAFLGLWVLAIVLGVKAARRKGVSPHWMWFGLHPAGAWIAYLIIRFVVSSPRKCPTCARVSREKARFCYACGSSIQG
jgi:hypothetical protein